MSKIVNPVMNYNGIVDTLRSKHKEYMDKYRVFLEKNLSEVNLERETTYARLRLLGEAFVKAEVIKGIKDIDIVGYNKSVALLNTYDVPVYLLNDGTSVLIASGNVAPADALSSRVFIANTGRGSLERYSDILSPDFNWEKFSMMVLDILHKSVCSQEDIMREFFNSKMV